jgi:DNA polymerase-2
VVSPQQGFILTRHWQDSTSGTEVEFWLATDDGPRHLRLAPQPSVAFVPTEQRERAIARLHGERQVDVRDLALRDFHHRPVSGLYCQSYRQLLKLEKALKLDGVDVFEADIRPPERYLMERFITAPVWFSGRPAETSPGPLLDAQLKPAPGYRPSLRCVSQYSSSKSMPAASLPWMAGPST